MRWIVYFGHGPNRCTLDRTDLSLHCGIWVVSAVILWNTRFLEAAIAVVAKIHGDTRADLIRHVAALGWEHIGLTGDYVWSATPLT